MIGTKCKCGAAFESDLHLSGSGNPDAHPFELAPEEEKKRAAFVETQKHAKGYGEAAAQAKKAELVKTEQAPVARQEAPVRSAIVEPNSGAATAVTRRTLEGDEIEYGAESAAIAAQAKALVAARFLVAERRPRDVDTFRRKLLNECERPGFAEVAEYSRPQGQKKITGPTIRFAEAALRLFGNVAVDTAVVNDGPERRTIRNTVTDLENNFTIAKDTIFEKTVERKNPADREVVGERLNTNGGWVYIVKSTEDEMQNKEAALISKAIRNEGLRLIPQDVVEDAMTTSRDTRSDSTAKDPALAVKQIVFWLNQRRIPVAEVERYIECPMDQATAAQLDDLVSICQAIDDGETTWRAIVEQKASADPNQQAKTATEARAAGLKNDIGKAKGAGGGGGAPAGTNGGNGERPASPAPTQRANRATVAPAAASGGDPRPEPPAPAEAQPAASEPQASTQAPTLAQDPQRQFDRVGYAVVDLADLTVEQLVEHANRVRTIMTPGEKSTARTAIAASNVEFLVGILQRVAEREAGKP